MDTFVLRKSVGSLSAGTVVDPAEYPVDMLTKLRPRTYEVPVRNRKVRRAEKAKERAIMEGLMKRG